MQKKCRVIAIANQKGGIGKTTTAVNLVTALKDMGYKTLLIDTDGQRNSSDTCKAKIDGEATLYDLLFENEPVENCIQHTELTDIIASDPILKEPDRKFPSDSSRTFVLKEACEPIIDKYDFIIIDTPPALGVVLSNVLTFATEVIIPVTCDRYGMIGIGDLNQTIKAAQKYTNRDLIVSGILLTMYKERTTLAKEITEALPGVVEKFNTKVFETKIRASEACRQSPSAQTSVIRYAPNSTTAKDYMELAKEIANGGIK